MSASREKNKRKEQAAVPETANEAKKGMSKGLKTTLIAVCTVLVVCIVVFIDFHADFEVGVERIITEVIQ